ncbi:MAG TPA: M14 family zinc carboxypeptidase, partial [Longimicrobiaceae bacterium]
MLRLVSRPLPLVLLPALLATPHSAHPQAPAEPPPSPEEFLGYPLGAHFTPAADVQAYARLLAATSAAAAYEEYGHTPERRDLFHLVIARAEHRTRLDEILAAHAELADPRTTESRAREIAARYPAVVYFSYGVHGNEPSSSEAAMWTAWDLLRGAAESATILDSLIVVLDPVVNPDGRDRYVEWYRSVAGATPNPDPRSREHREPWPTGRYNHYLVDLNRDWAWATQPETRARLARWWRWNPLVHVDFHEMDFTSSYFFFPAAAPINPVYPEHILRWGERFGKENARAFDARGWAYFTGDEYDLFYPGYGDSWPSLLGAIGMTYEQAGNGAAGLAIRRPSGDTLTLRDRALRHWTSGMTTLRTAAAGKTDLMLDFAAAQRDVGRGQPDVLLVPGPDTLRLAALIRHLRLQGIVAERAAAEFRADAAPHPGFETRSIFPAGTFRVPARQARGRLATTLLAPTVPLRAESSYDISAWSLPYAYG